MRAGIGGMMVALGVVACSATPGPRSDAGASGQGATGQGATGRGATGQGATGQGATQGADATTRATTASPAEWSARLPTTEELRTFLWTEYDRTWGSFARSDQFYEGSWRFDGGWRYEGESELYAGNIVYGHEWTILIDSKTAHHCRADVTMGRRWLVCLENESPGNGDIFSMAPEEVPKLEGKPAKLSQLLCERCGTPPAPRRFSLNVRPVRPTTRTAMHVWAALNGDSTAHFFRDPDKNALRGFAGRADGQGWSLEWSLSSSSWERDSWTADLVATFTRLPEPRSRDAAASWLMDVATFRSSIHIEPEPSQFAISGGALSTQRFRCSQVRRGTRAEHTQCDPES